MGITLVHFKPSGKIPVCIDLFIICVIGVTVSDIVLINNLGEISSFPELGFGLIFFAILMISSESTGSRNILWS